MKKISIIFIAVILLFGFNTLNGESHFKSRDVELMTNGDLETWTDTTHPTEWDVIENIVQETTIVHSGSYSAKQTAGTKDFRQDVSGIVQGQTYTISYWYLDNDPAARARIWSYWLVGNTTISSNTAELRPNTYSDDSEGWQQYSVTIEAPSSVDGLRFEVRSYNVSPGGGVIYWDDFSVQAIGGNTSPSINNIVQTPNSNITSSTTVSVSADITDSDGTIAGAELHWGTSSGNLSTIISMSNTSGDTYVTDSDIPAQSDGTTVYYEVYAMDDDLDETTSSEQNYIVADPQPLNADFEANITSAFVDQNITFTDLSTGGTGGYTYAWDFNNDTITDSSDENPIYSYSSVGTYTVTVTITDGAKGSDSETKVDYITVTEAPNVASELLISEYVEKGNDKAIELFNGTGSPVDLSIYTVEVYFNGSTSGNSISLSGTLATNEVYVIAYNQAVSSIQNIADNITNTLGFNGDDAVALLKDGTVIDVIGQIGNDPGSSWTIGASGSTADQTLVRKSSIFSPNPVDLASFGSDDDNCEWDFYPEGTYSNLGAHTFDGSGVEEGTVATPVISPEAGEYVLEVEVSITCETDGATIYYTTDGSSPSTSSNQYNGAFTLTESKTVKAYAVKAGNTDSYVAEAAYTITSPDPLVADFSANTTSITEGEQVTFTDLTSGGVPGYLYSWDLDGDGEEDSASANPVFEYNTAGTYTVELLIYDQELTESVETKVDYITVYPNAVDPVVGNLFISEVSDANAYQNEYIELFNNSDQLISLDNITLRMNLTTNFELNDVSYNGDRNVQPHSYIIITRGNNQASFESEFGALPAGVSFLQGSTSMFFGTSSQRRWQLVLITEAKAETIIDDTVQDVGGSGNTSYQSSPGNWVTINDYSQNTPGGPTDDQTLPVSLASFMAVQTSDYFAQLTWVTHSESGIAGYNIYRSEMNNESTAVQVNDNIIEANNQVTTTTYTYTDEKAEMNKTYYYWLESYELSGSSVMFGPVIVTIGQNNDTPEIVIPTKTVLRSIYPNPFNPTTTVNFYMDKADDVTINVFNVRGQLINTITRDNFTEGFHNVVWNGKDLDGRDCASGIYFFRMETKDESQMVKGVLMK